MAGSKAETSKDTQTKSLSIALPSSMLTPLSAIPSPTVDVSLFKTVSQSPPGSGLTTPTDGPVRFFKQRDSIEMSTTSAAFLLERKPSVPTLSSDIMAPLNLAGPRPEPQSEAYPHSFHHEQRKFVSPAQASDGGGSSLFSFASASTTTPMPSKHPPLSPVSHPSSTSHVLSPIGIVLSPASAGNTRPPGGGIFVQPHIRGSGGTHSTVVASPIKYQASAAEHSKRRESERESEKEESRKKEKEKDRDNKDGDEGIESVGPLVKRLRVTRRSVVEESWELIVWTPAKQ